MISLKFRVFVISILLFSSSHLIHATTFNLGVSSRAAIAHNEGSQDGFFQSFDPNATLIGSTAFGFGHGNRINSIQFFNLSAIAATREEGKRFVVTNAMLSMTEGEGLEYSGAISIHATQLDWLSNNSLATWNNMEAGASGSPGFGEAVATGGRINSSTIRVNPSSDPNSGFNQLVAAWLNGEQDNFGIYVRTTGSKSSWDGYGASLQLNVTQEVDLSAIPEPASWIFMVCGISGVLLRRKATCVK